MDTQEGKAPLSFMAYSHLAKKSMQDITKIGSFAHLFLVLAWNLVARCTSVASLDYQHITWADDSMRVVFPAHKGDEAGENAAPKHVYANTESPELCPILAFALYEFSFGERRAGQQAVFVDVADNIESRFSKWLATTFERDASLAGMLNVRVSEIGTHSFRKGAATYLFGMSGFGTSAAIFLRAGWSLGAVQNRYIGIILY
jgi:hypothetical protein